MTITKRVFSVILATVMLVTCFTIGFHGVAADITYYHLVNALKSEYVRDMKHYDDKSESTSWHEDAANIAYHHIISARDNSDNEIGAAATEFYNIVESLQSFQYGVGLYSLDLIAKEVLTQLEERMSDESRIIRVDNQGRRYKAVDRLLISESQYRMTKNSTYRLTYAVLPADASYKQVNWRSSNTNVAVVDSRGTVYTKNVAPGASATIYGTTVDGNKVAAIQILVVAPENGAPDPDPINYPAQVQPETQTAPEPIYETEYQYYNVARVIEKFCGGAGDINSANWFHTFSFYVQTDVEQWIMDVAPNTPVWYMSPSTVIPIERREYTWNHVRTYDASGTEARYVLAPGGYVYNYTETEDTETIADLVNINQIFNDNSVMMNPENAATNASWSNAECATFIATGRYDIWIEKLKGYSNEMLVKLFGNKIFAIMANYNTVRPNYSYSDAQSAGIPGLSAKYYCHRIVRGDATYSATTQKLNDVVRNIDSLLTNNSIGEVVSLFFDLRSEDFVNSGLAGAQFSTVSELLKILIQKFLYQDNIATLIMQKVYPLLKGLIDGISLPVLGNVSGTIYSILRDKDVYIQNPKQISNRWRANVSPSMSHFVSLFPDVVRWLDNHDVSWTDVPEEDFLHLKWNINGSRQRFEYALAAAISGINGLLPTVFGDRDIGIAANIGKIEAVDGYRIAILPLLENLQIGAADGLLPRGEYLTQLNAGNGLQYILTPLLNWVENKLVEHPIEIICNILPALSDIICKPENGNSKLQNWLEALKINIKIVGISVYNPTVWSFLPNDLKDNLTSLNQAITHFTKKSFSTKLEVGRDEFDRPIYATTGEVDNAGNPEYVKVPLALPPLSDRKIQDCGENRVYNSLLDGTQYRRETDNVGLVLLYLLRYVFYGINYTKGGSGTWTEPTLLNAFLDNDKLKNDLFAGVTIEGLVTNIVLNPEAAICAIVELFYPNETTVNTSTPIRNTYPVEYIDYKNDDILGHGAFGANVRYSQYWTRDYAISTVNDISALIDNVLKMLKVDDVNIGGTSYSLRNGITAFLQEIVNDKLFSNEVLSAIAGLMFPALQSLSGSIDIGKIIEAVLGIKYDLESMAKIIHYKAVTENAQALGITAGSNVRSQVESNIINEIQEAGGTDYAEWSTYLFYEKVQKVDENNELVFDENNEPVYQKGAAYDWGLNDTVNFIGENSRLKLTKEELFFDNLYAIVAPAAELLRFILLGKDVALFKDGSANGLGVITVPTYESYFYVCIPIYEALSCPAASIKTYNEVYTRSEVSTLIPGTTVEIGDLYLVEDIINPIRGFLNATLADPINMIFKLIPNLMFFLLIGGLNGIVNNLLHFAYVLLDILKPIVDAVPIVNNLLKGLDIGGMDLGLSIPLDVDLNAVVNKLLGKFLFGGLLSLDLLGAPLRLELPYIDLTMLCTGIPEAFSSRSGYQTVYLSSGGGADLLTVLLNFLMDTIFMNNNAHNIADWLTASQQLDSFDDETLHLSFEFLNVLANEKEMPDRVLYFFYIIINKLTPLSGSLADRFDKVDFGLIAMFQNLGGTTDAKLRTLIDRIRQLAAAGDQSQPAQAASGLLAKLMEFFAKLKAFFRALFSGMRATA